MHDEPQEKTALEAPPNGLRVLFHGVVKDSVHFVQYYDNKNRYPFNETVFHCDFFAGKTNDQIAAGFGWKHLYSQEVTLSKGQSITAWALGNNDNVYAYTIDPSQAHFKNAQRLHPPAITWKSGQKERYDKAEAIFHSGHYSYQGIIDLYDPRQDNDHICWLVLMGLAYSNPRDLFYDERKSYDFFVNAAKLGSDAASFDLAINWESGYFGKISLENAVKWYVQAFDEDNVNAGIALFNIFRKDTRYKSEPAFKKTALEIFDRAQKLGGMDFKYYDSKFKINGFWGTKDSKASLNLHEELAAIRPITHRFIVNALYELAQHYYLGIDVHRNIKKALRYLDDIPADLGDFIVTPTLKNSAQKLRSMIEAELNSQLVCPSKNTMRDLAPAISASFMATSHLLWTNNYEVSTITWASIAAPCFLKAITAKPDSLVKYTAAALSATGSGFCVYAATAHKIPLQDILQQLWRHRTEDLIGFLAVAGCASLTHLWAQTRLKVGTTLRSAACLTVATGLYFGIPNLSKTTNISNFFSQTFSVLPTNVYKNLSKNSALVAKGGIAMEEIATLSLNGHDGKSVCVFCHDSLTAARFSENILGRVVSSNNSFASALRKHRERKIPITQQFKL